MSRDLSNRGIALSAGFLVAEAVDAIRNELAAALPFVHIMTDRRSVYARESIDASAHPAVAMPSDWIAGHVTRDMIPAHSAAHRLYVSPLFKRLVATAVGVDRVFEYSDPLAGLVATVLPPGGCYGWHYDTNEFVVTIPIECATMGGIFEFHRDLRRPGDENLAGLERSLAGKDMQNRQSVASAPGTLQIFLGRYSLHRVTAVEGCHQRVSLVLSYADRPGVIGPVDRTRRVYGRVTETHLLAAATQAGADGLIL